MNAQILRKQRKNAKIDQAVLLEVSASKTTILSDNVWLWESSTSKGDKCWIVTVKLSSRVGTFGMYCNHNDAMTVGRFVSGQSDIEKLHRDFWWNGGRFHAAEQPHAVDLASAPLRPNH